MKNLQEENELLKDELQKLKLEVERTAALQLEKDRLRDEYEQSQLRFRTVFEGSSVGKKIIDDQLRIIKVNRALVNILGYTADELTGRRITDLAHPDFMDHWQDLPKELWTTELDSFNFDTCLIKKDGTTIWLHVTTIIINDEGGKLGYTILEDISERKELERVKDLVRDQEQRQQVAETVLSTQEDERRRMAERLHNGLGQLLYGVKLSLNQISSAPAHNSQAVRYSDGLLANCIKECRSIAHDLMPTMLDNGLKEAVADLCDQLSESLRCEHSVIGLKQRLPEFLEVVIYRMLQEALMNVIKHANASLVSINIMADKKDVKIRVRDDGNGFDKAKLVKKGIGLHTLRTKAEFLSGTFNINSAEGKGTTVLITIPRRVN